MKIVLMDVPRHLASSIQYYLLPLHEIVIRSHTTISEEDLNADIWLFAFNINTKTFLERQEFIFNLVERFQGKICYVDTSDIGFTSNLYTLYEVFFRRLHCIFITTETDFVRSKFRRRILYPKFTINYIPHTSVKKLRRVYFRGSLTGGYKLYGKNHRVEAIKILNNLNVPWADCKMYATESQKNFRSIIQLKEDAENKQIIDSLPTSLLKKADYLTDLCNSTTSLCLPGNAVWCYRHLESIAFNCNVISLSVDYDPGFWLGRNKLDECFNILNFDLSNLQEICEYAISDDISLRDRREYAYSVYQQEYELTPENHFKLHIWTKLKQDMQKHSILP